jgi:hypothetical protein
MQLVPLHGGYKQMPLTHAVGAAQVESSCDPSRLKPPGFNPRTHQVRNWFQAFCFHKKCSLHRYNAAPLQPKAAAGLPGRIGGRTVRKDGKVGRDKSYGSTRRGLVGLYKLNPVDPNRLKAPGFNP